MNYNIGVGTAKSKERKKEPILHSPFLGSEMLGNGHGEIGEVDILILW